MSPQDNWHTQPKRALWTDSAKCLSSELEKRDCPLTQTSLTFLSVSSMVAGTSGIRWCKETIFFYSVYTPPHIWHVWCVSRSEIGSIKQIWHEGLMSLGFSFNRTVKCLGNIWRLKLRAIMKSRACRLSAKVLHIFLLKPFKRCSFKHLNKKTPIGRILFQLSSLLITMSFF